MIRKLQRKFVIITMASLLLVMTLIIGSINAINFYQINHRIDGILQMLTDNDGRFPKFEKGGGRPPRPSQGPHFNAETPFQTRYFTVQAAPDKTVIQIDTGHIAAITSSEAEEYGIKVLKNGRAMGYLGTYKYKQVEKPYGTLIVFVDCSSQLSTGFSFLLISLGIACASFLLVLILVGAFSKKAIQPVIASMEKQKQFITDASHEIKTPLAIISANAEVLEMTSGQNEWIDSIRNQIGRLDQLVKDLLTLSKMDEGGMKLVFTDFSLSDAVEETVKPFESVAEAQGKKLEMKIQQQVSYKGAESALRQLVSILTDNAFKYSDEHGTIRVSLSQSGKSTKLEVFNTVEAVTEEHPERWFDRFYRSDASRSRQTGGYGIGLSIARTIVEAHKGRILVKNVDGKAVAFTVKL